VNIRLQRITSIHGREEHIQACDVRFRRARTRCVFLKTASVTFVLLLLSTWTIHAGDVPTEQQLANWHQWRGPFANGTAADDATPPVEWSNNQNVAWHTDLPGEGTSTPIVWGNQVFVLSAEQTDRKSEAPPKADERSKTVPPDVYYRFYVTSIGRTTGKVLWQKLAVEDVPHEGHHPTHTYAGSSPTTDGERLYVSFGSRGIYCYSLSGQLLWKTNLGEMRTRYGWGEAVTPVIHRDSLVVNWDQEEGSFITCLDASTGDAKWKTKRSNEVTSWNTPLVTSVAGREVVIANGTNKVRAYDLADGKELWSCGGQTVNAIPSPVRFENSVIAMSGYRGSLAVSIPLDSQGDVTGADSVRVLSRRGTPYVPSPLLHNGRLFFTAANRDILSVLDAATGQSVTESRRLTGLRSVYASPIAANGHVYFVGREGTCVVLKDNASFEVAAVNQINDRIDASPVVVGNSLFLRSWTKLYCVQE
jgi:outer membrane protein assembly factor BamB